MSHTLCRLQRLTSEILRRSNIGYLACRSTASYADVVSYTERSHSCGCLKSADVGRSVRLCGWVRNRRMSGYFLLIGDWQGVTQLVMEQPDLVQTSKTLPYESVVEVTGKVRNRQPGQENKLMLTGDVEVVVDSLNVLNPADKNLPFEVSKPALVKEALRMEYRHLDIRTNKMQRNLRLRSKMIMKMREFLSNKHEFVDVETPTLFRRTPGGAKEFVVPSRFPGKFYSLPQSPQQFKQLLMAGGIDRYYQIAKCFRDEGSKPDRQPEFTQLDLEMSFVDREGVLRLVEEMLVDCWPEPLTTPFPRMTYDTAIQQYGSDKPDTRFDMKLHDITNLFDRRIKLRRIEVALCQGDSAAIAIRIPNAEEHFSKTTLKMLTQKAEEITKVSETQLCTLSDLIVKPGQFSGLPFIFPEIRTAVINNMGLKPGDAVIMALGSRAKVQTYMGKFRLLVADLLESKGVVVRDNSFNFLWVVDFPLFLEKEDEDSHSGELESAHHPFTDVHPDDRHLLNTHPAKVRGQHYDLVLNGNEVGGGSIRIHKAEDQQYILTEILKEDSSELSHLLEAFKMGCPPHGGIALGLDRLFAVVTGSESIRDVIAFPKSSEGRDLMSKAPTEISKQQLHDYHIQVVPTQISKQQLADFQVVNKDGHSTDMTNTEPDTSEHDIVAKT